MGITIFSTKKNPMQTSFASGEKIILRLGFVIR